MFAYGDNLLCEDGGLYNDAQTTWRYTTTFHLIAVVEAYLAGQEILPQDAKEKFRDRIVRMAEWLYRNLDEKSPANINYSTTNGLALALAGKFLCNADYLRQAKRLTDYAMAHFTENGFLYGESKPHDKKSALGLYGIDLGYNAEESVPALVKYACLVGDEGMKDKLSKVLARQAEFLFPDGGWDNSFGNRNNKWTYWGSRTSDGCAPAYLLLADRDPSFAESRPSQHFAPGKDARKAASCTAGRTIAGTGNMPARITPSSTQTRWRMRWKTSTKSISRPNG